MRIVKTAQIKIKKWIGVFCFIMLTAYWVNGQESVYYELNMKEPQTHYFEVIIKLTNIKHDEVTLKMPVWAPGSYLVREFAKNVEGFECYNDKGNRLKNYKIDKNTWRVEKTKAQTITIKYLVYAYELSVRTSYLNKDFGYINGTSVFMFLDQAVSLPCTLKINLFPEWKIITTALEPIGQHIYKADNYDVLVDSPIQMGNHTVFDFTASGVKHTVAMVGPGNYMVDTLKKDMAKIVEACTSVFGENPNKNYTFIIHNLTNPSGGLEHLSSTTLQVNRFTYAPRNNYLNFLSLVAHEYFHLWNVKRIRPLSLGPFDYNKENYTNLLYVSEGFTSYYEELLMVKAGFKNPNQYLEYMAGTIGSVEITPGNKVQTLAESSFDAWIKAYRPNENSHNSTISYYGKGEVMGCLFDLAIIKATNGKKNLDDLMNYLYKVYYKEKKRGFTDDEFKVTVKQVAGQSFDDLFESIYTTRTPDYQKYLEGVGVSLVILYPDTNKPLLGATFQEINGKLIIKGVQRNTAAYNDGLNVEDEIIAVDGYRVNQDKLNKYIQNLLPGTKVKFLISRDDLLKEITVELKPNYSPKYYLVNNQQKTPEQQKYFNCWMRETNK